MEIVWSNDIVHTEALANAKSYCYQIIDFLKLYYVGWALGHILVACSSTLPLVTIFFLLLSLSITCTDTSLYLAILCHQTHHLWLNNNSFENSYELCRLETTAHSQQCQCTYLYFFSASSFSFCSFLVCSSNCCTLLSTSLGCENSHTHMLTYCYT